MRGLAHDDIDILADLHTETVQRQIIDILAKGVLNLAPNKRQSQYDVRGKDGRRNGNPFETIDELEGQHQDIHPCDLGNGDGIGQRQRGVEDPIDAVEDVVDLRKQRQSHAVIARGFERPILDDGPDVIRARAVDFQRHITQRLGRVLHEHSRILLHHGQPQKHASTLPPRRRGRFLDDGIVSNHGDVADAGLQVLVVREGLVSEAVLERHAERDEHVAKGDFGEQVLRGTLWSLVGMHPDESGEALRHAGELGPVSTAFAVAFVGGRVAERERQTDDEAEDGEQDGTNTD